MKKIVFFSSWSTPTKLLERYSALTPGNSGRWLNIVGVDNVDVADYIIILDPLKEFNDKYNNKIKIVLQREPEYVSSIDKIYETKADKYFCYENGSYLFSTWWINKPFDEIEDLPYKKTKGISAIVSGKTNFDGHKKRIGFVERVSKKYEEIDVFGKNLNRDNFGKGFKGEIVEKFDGLYDYKHSIAIENGVRKNYFSEKICDCFLTMTKPLYYGCPNIDEFFPKECFINIDINNTISEEEMLKINNSETIIKSMYEARNLVMYKYNLWPSLKRIIDEM